MKWISKDEIAKNQGIKIFDTAVPQQWLNDIHNIFEIQNIVSHFVWSYDIDRTFGRPHPLSPKACLILYGITITVNMIDNKYPKIEEYKIVCKTLGKVLQGIEQDDYFPSHPIKSKFDKLYKSWKSILDFYKMDNDSYHGVNLEMYLPENYLDFLKQLEN